MEYGTTITTALEFDEAVDRTRAALAEQGFGVLTEIDVQATLKSKLDEDMEPYLILGACNPQLAHQALAVEPRGSRRHRSVTRPAPGRHMSTCRRSTR